MEFIKYSVENGQLNGLHHRFIQPPQVAYFVSTVDSFGNVNVTPVTMGTCIGHNFFRSLFQISMWELMNGIKIKMFGKTA